MFLSADGSSACTTSYKSGRSRGADPDAHLLLLCSSWRRVKYIVTVQALVNGPKQTVMVVTVRPGLHDTTAATLLPMMTHFTCTRLLCIRCHSESPARERPSRAALFFNLNSRIASSHGDFAEPNVSIYRRDMGSRILCRPEPAPRWHFQCRELPLQILVSIDMPGALFLHNEFCPADVCSPLRLPLPSALYREAGHKPCLRIYTSLARK